MAKYNVAIVFRSFHLKKIVIAIINENTKTNNSKIIAGKWILNENISSLYGNFHLFSKSYYLFDLNKFLLYQIRQYTFKVMSYFEFNNNSCTIIPVKSEFFKINSHFSI